MTLTSFWRRYLPASLKKATSSQLSVLSAVRISRHWIHQRLSPRSNTSTHLLRLTEEHRVTQTALSALPRCKFRQKKSLEQYPLSHRVPLVVPMAQHLSTSKI